MKKFNLSVSIIFALLLFIAGISSSFAINIDGEDSVPQEANHYYFDKFLYDDGKFLYFSIQKADSSIPIEDKDLKVAKIDLNLKSNAVLLSDDEKTKILSQYEKLNLKKVRICENRDGYKGVDEECVLGRQNNTLIDKSKGLFLIDLKDYISANDKFYAENKNYQKTDIYVSATRFEIDKEYYIYGINTRYSLSIPPPYTPSFYDVIAVKNGKVSKLNVSKEFDLDKVYKNSDGSFFLAGTNEKGRYDKQEIIYHLSADGKLTNINSLVSKQGINAGYIGWQNDKLVFYVNQKYTGIAAPNHKYEFYQVDNNLKVTERTEKRIVGKKDYTMYLFKGDIFNYLSSQNHIYTFDNYSEKIIDLTANKAGNIDFNPNNYKLSEPIGKFESTNEVIELSTNPETNGFKPFPIYKVDNKTYIVAEDLVYIGFEHIWYENYRISAFIGAEPKKGNPARKFNDGDIYHSDVVILINNNKVYAKNIGGFSLIPIDKKNVYGIVDKKTYKPVVMDKNNPDYKYGPEYANRKEVSVKIPNKDKITVNGQAIDNKTRKYPFIKYKDITYVPMTTSDMSFMGAKIDWNYKTRKLSVTTIDKYGAYIPDLAQKTNPLIGTATIPEYDITVQTLKVDNTKEQYPLLNFRDVTYFPLTWRFCTEQFGWNYNWSENIGLVITSH